MKDTEEREKRLRELEAQMSPQHLRFSRLFASGEYSAAAAYRECYPECAVSTSQTNGSRLAGSPRVSEYVRLLSGVAADHLVVNRAMVVAELWRVATERYGDDAKASGAVVAALKTLLDYQGGGPTTKVEVSGKVDNTHTHKGGMSEAMTRAIITETMGLTDAQADAFFGKGGDDGAE